MVADFLLMKSASLAPDATGMKSDAAPQQDSAVADTETGGPGFGVLFQQAAGEMDEVAAVALPDSGKLLPQRQDREREETAPALSAEDFPGGREEAGIPLRELHGGTGAVPLTERAPAGGEVLQSGISRAEKMEDPAPAAGGWSAGENGQGLSSIGVTGVAWDADDPAATPGKTGKSEVSSFSMSRNGLGYAPSAGEDEGVADSTEPLMGMPAGGIHGGFQAGAASPEKAGQPAAAGDAAPLLSAESPIADGHGDGVPMPWTSGSSPATSRPADPLVSGRKDPPAMEAAAVTTPGRRVLLPTGRKEGGGNSSAPGMSFHDQPVKEAGLFRMDEGGSVATPREPGIPLHGENGPSRELPAENRGSAFTKDSVIPGPTPHSVAWRDPAVAAGGERPGPSSLFSGREGGQPGTGNFVEEILATGNGDLSRVARSPSVTVQTPLISGGEPDRVAAFSQGKPDGEALSLQEGLVRGSAAAAYPAAMQAGSRHPERLLGVGEETPSLPRSRHSGGEQLPGVARATSPQTVASGVPAPLPVQGREERPGKGEVSLQPPGEMVAGPAGNPAGRSVPDGMPEAGSQPGTTPEGNDVSMPDPQGVARGFQVSPPGGTAQPSNPTPAQPAVVQGAVEEPLGHQAWEKSMARQLANLAGEGEQRASLRLNPSNLGPLDVHIVTEEGEARIQFTSHHAVVREAVEAALPRLRDLFQGSGLNLVEVDVSRQDAAARQQTSGGSAGREQGQDAPAGFQNLENTEALSSAVETGLGDRLIDYYA